MESEEAGVCGTKEGQQTHREAEGKNGAEPMGLSAEEGALLQWLEAYEQGEENTCEYRRERVMAHMRGQGMPTIELLKNVAESFTYGTVEVDEYPAERRFTLRFTGADGVPPNLDDLMEIIEQIKPSHLGFGFTFTYTTHSELERQKYSQLAVMQHDQVRRLENVRSN